MPAKKKSKPSFQVPEELQTAPQAGWVYRSEEQSGAKAHTSSKPAAGGKTAGKAKRVDAPPAVSGMSTPAEKKTSPAREAKPVPKPKSDSSSKSSSSLLDITAKALSAGFGTAGGLILLTTTVVAAPFALGKRLLHL